MLFKKLILIGIICIGCISLEGCTMAMTKDNLKSSPDTIKKRVVVDGNYQSLLKCWDDHAEKVVIDFANVTQTQIYQALGKAEITAGGGGGAYYLIVELQSMKGNKTSVEGFGSGYLGQKYIPKYIQDIKHCSKGW